MDQSKFVFNILKGEEAEKQLDLKINAIDTFITKQINKATVAHQGMDVPILSNILSICRDPIELNQLADAIKKVAVHIKEYDELLNRKRVLELIRQEPGFLAASFADIDDELNIFLEDFHD